MHITVQIASLDDLPELVSLAECVATEVSGTRGGDLWIQKDWGRHPHYSDSFSQSIQNLESEYVLLGLIDESIIGYCVVQRDQSDSPIACIRDLYVLPEARGVGVGESLMDEALLWSKHHNCIGIQSIVLPGNRITKNFFERYGVIARSLTLYKPFS